jgi:hypothetical protein
MSRTSLSEASPKVKKHHGFIRYDDGEGALTRAGETYGTSES